jgi:hypothetical protein
MVWTHKFALLLVKHQRVTRLFQDLLLDLRILGPRSTVWSAWLCEQLGLTDWCILIVNYRGAELCVSQGQGENEAGYLLHVLLYLGITLWCPEVLIW